MSYYATFDNWKVGTMQGEYIVEQLDLENAAGPFNIELFTGEARELTIDLSDVSGRAVFSRRIALEPRIYQQLRLEDAVLTSLTNGQYTLRASLDGRAEMTRALVKVP